MKFHRLTFLSDAGIVGRTRRWLMRCECGTEQTFVAADVKRGHTKSCGCKQIDRLKKNPPAYRHGMISTPTYRSWTAMKSRCADPQRRFYFGRGIRVCDRWQSFSNFVADMGERPTGTTLDRIDSNGNYEPGNCRWLPSKKQARNRRDNLLITFNGITRCAAEWAESTGIPSKAIRYRLSAGWPLERVLSKPSRRPAIARLRT